MNYCSHWQTLQTIRQSQALWRRRVLGRLFFFRLAACALFIICNWSAAVGADSSIGATNNLPDTALFMEKAIERARSMATNQNGYTWRKITVFDEFEGEKVVKSTTKEYQVTLVAGYPLSRLLRIQGQNLSPEAIEKENQREEAFQRRITAVDQRTMARRRETWLTSNIIDRFEYTVRERKTVDGRPAIVVDFTSKRRQLPINSFQDNIMSKLAGALTFDEEDFGLARLSVRLKEPVPLGWFGVLGSIDRCDITMERKRFDEGVWLNLKQQTIIAGRRLFSPMSLRITETSSDFERKDQKQETRLEIKNRE